MATGAFAWHQGKIAWYCHGNTLADTESARLHTGARAVVQLWWWRRCGRNGNSRDGGGVGHAERAELGRNVGEARSGRMVSLTMCCVTRVEASAHGVPCTVSGVVGRHCAGCFKEKVFNLMIVAGAARKAGVALGAEIALGSVAVRAHVAVPAAAVGADALVAALGRHFRAAQVGRAVAVRPVAHEALGRARRGELSDLLRQLGQPRARLHQLGLAAVNVRAHAAPRTHFTTAHVRALMYTLAHINKSVIFGAPYFYSL